MIFKKLCFTANRQLTISSKRCNIGGKDDLKSLFDRYKVNATSTEKSFNDSKNMDDKIGDGEDKLKSLFAKFSQTNTTSSFKTNNRKAKTGNSNNLNDILGVKMKTSKPKQEKKKNKFNSKRDIDYTKIPEKFHTAVKWINKEATKEVLIHEPTKQFFQFKNITQLINDTNWNLNGLLIKKQRLSYPELKAFITDDLTYIPIAESDSASVVSIIPIDKVDLEHYKSLEKKNIIMRLGGSMFLEKIEEKEANILEASNLTVSNNKIFKPIPVNWDCQVADLNRKFDTASRVMKKGFKIEFHIGPAAYLKAAMFNKTHLNKVHDVTRSGMKNNTEMSAKQDKEFKEDVEQFFITRKYNANKSLSRRNNIYEQIVNFLGSLNAKYKTFGNVETFIVISVHEYNLKAREELLVEIGKNMATEDEVESTSNVNAILKPSLLQNGNKKDKNKDKRNSKEKEKTNSKKEELIDFYSMKIED
ncbi:hypothetical protein QEN19_000616 [Hanseniaspora menglaensis]